MSPDAQSETRAVAASSALGWRAEGIARVVVVATGTVLGVTVVGSVVGTGVLELPQPVAVAANATTAATAPMDRAKVVTSPL